MTEAPPRVFISYSHDSAEHRDRVLELADRLRADGIDAMIDQYVQFPPEGWPAWCEAEIRKAAVFERLGDARERAMTMGKIADILQARGQLDEALKFR